MEQIQPLDMTSKRSSRAYVDDPGHRQNPHSKTPNTPFRSRRNSYNSTMGEPMQKAARDADDEPWNGVSIREAIAIACSQSATAIANDISAPVSSKSSDTMSSAASSLSSSLSSYSETSYLDHPPAPLNGRPLNFGVVVPGVYRSSYPKSSDFGYIRGLQLKTMVTLVMKENTDGEMESFLTREGIRHVIFNMKGTKKESVPLQQMKSILSVVLNKENHPLMIHCNHGKHRTGCVVGVVRKVSGWDTPSVLAEYKSYAEPKARDCDLDYISTFQLHTLRSTTNTIQTVQHSPVQIRSFFRALFFSTFVLLLWLVSGSRICTAMKHESLK